MSPLYVGELNGARVLQVGIGVQDVTLVGTTPVLFDVTTQDVFPAGGGASIEFTQLNVTIRHTNGFSVGVTPIVDGVPDDEQQFNVSAATVGTDGVFTVKAPFRARGERCAAQVRMLSASDVVELVDIAATYVPIRQSV